jgi:hypothetical protein
VKPPWERALLLLENMVAKHFISDVEDAEEGLITERKTDVQLAASENLQGSSSIPGKLKKLPGKDFFKTEYDERKCLNNTDAKD